MKTKSMIIAPLVLLSMTLVTSCNRATFVRHTFKDSFAKEEYETRLQKIRNAQYTEEEPGEIYLKSDKGTLKLTSSYMSNTKADNIIIENYSKNENVILNYYEPNKVLKLENKLYNSTSGETNDTEYLKYSIENKEAKFIMAIENHLTGRKIRGYYDKYELDDPSKFNILYILSGKIGAQIFNLDFMYPFLTIAKMDNPNRDLMACPFGEYKGISVVSFAEKFPNLIDNLIFKTNDEKSMSVSYKAEINYEDYFKAIQKGKITEGKDFSGKVYVDMFWCIENNFFTQVDFKIKVDNAKVTSKVMIDEEEKDVQFVVNQESTMTLDADYTNGPSIDVNLDEYIPIV